MKNILYTGLILLTLGISGCEEQLEVLPENSLTLNNALTTPQDFESAIWGVEQILRTSGIQNDPLRQELKGYYADIIDDYNIALKNNYNSVEIVSYNTQHWQDYYRGIAAANTVLNRVDDAPLSKDRRNLYKGQALFFKAIFYYKIIQRWGDCMLVKDDVLLQPQAKTPWHEVAAYATELTREAVRLLPEFNQMTNWKGAAYANKAIPAKGSANALLAYLCAWQAGCKYFANNPDYDEQQLWKEAEQACSEIIESKVYELEPNPEAVCTQGLVENSSESIYETVNRGFEYEVSSWGDTPSLVNLLAYSCGHRFWYPESSSDITSINSPYGDKILVSTVNKWYGTGDARKESYFYRVNEFEEQTGGYAWCYKYRNVMYDKEIGYIIGLNQNKVWWRLADIYLLRAECRARLGGEYTAGAIDDLNKIRDRAGAKRYESTEDGGDLRYTIFLERQKELFLEGHRYFDVIRNGYVNTELHGNFKTLSVQDMKDGALFMCIGSSAFDNNPLLRQNTYWFRRM